MNKKIVIIILIFLMVVFTLVFRITKEHDQPNPKSYDVSIEKEEKIGDYSIIYNEKDSVYELYDKYGKLITVSTSSEGCKLYIENESNLTNFEESLEE